MAEVGAEWASPAEYCLWFSCLQNVMGEIWGRNLLCRILNIKSSVVQEDSKQIVRGWEGIWGRYNLPVFSLLSTGEEWSG